MDYKTDPIYQTFFSDHRPQVVQERENGHEQQRDYPDDEDEDPVSLSLETLISLLEELLGIEEPMHGPAFSGDAPAAAGPISAYRHASLTARDPVIRAEGEAPHPPHGHILSTEDDDDSRQGFGAEARLPVLEGEARARAERLLSRVRALQRAGWRSLELTEGRTILEAVENAVEAAFTGPPEE